MVGAHVCGERASLHDGSFDDERLDVYQAARQFKRQSITGNIAEASGKLSRVVAMLIRIVLSLEQRTTGEMIARMAPPNPRRRSLSPKDSRL